jgi:hypothetical protein
LSKKDDYMVLAMGRNSIDGAGNQELTSYSVGDSITATKGGVVRERVTANTTPDEKFILGDYVRKKGDKGQWHGKVCGFYSTDCTPNGVAVESVFEANSVQIYPANALEPWDRAAKAVGGGAVDPIVISRALSDDELKAFTEAYSNKHSIRLEPTQPQSELPQPPAVGDE